MRIRFVGETMTCTLYGKVEKSDPGVETQWRCIELDSVGYYVCPKHFPPDGSPSRRYERAYTKVLHHLIAIHRRRYRGLRQ